MSGSGVQRRLAAILAADVVGYSASMETDEEATFERITALRRDIIQPALLRYHGRLFKTTGDGALAEFGSALDAVKCAAEIQELLSSDTAHLKLRIGINLGDVIIDEHGDVYGEGINIAARLEGLATPGGILISGKVYDEVKGKLNLPFDDAGERQLKNIRTAVRTFSCSLARQPSTAVSSDHYEAAQHSSIAVLPFQNMSGDPEQEYFADGLVEDIITELSRFKSLFVIARNTTFTFKGKPIDIKKVGRELGVRYVLEGSVRKSAGRLRITAQLIDSGTGAHVWAERFDGEDRDIFDLQDQVTARVAGTLSPKIERAEIERLKRKPPGSLSAHDAYLRGLSAVYLGTEQSTGEALNHLYQAISLDEQFAAAYGLAALCFVRRKSNSWTTDFAADGAETRRLADSAAAFGHDDAAPLAAAGYSLAYVLGELGIGRDLTERAIQINTNLAWAWLFSGWIQLWCGELDPAIERVLRAMKLSPHDPQMFNMQCAVGCANFFSGRHEEAKRWASLAIKSWPNHHPSHALAVAAHAQMGDLAGAKQALDQLLRLRKDFSVSSLKASLPLLREHHFAMWEEGLRKAGVT